MFCMVFGAQASPDFERLKSLVGIWQKEGSENSHFQIEFYLTANETVLVEKWMRKGVPHSLTLYHKDGKDVLATHYCPQGNQPRLKLKPASSDATLSFDFLDATNLKSEDDNHQHNLSIEFADDSHIIRKESYRKSGQSDHSELKLIKL